MAANPFLRLNDLVYTIIESAIVSGELPPGTKLSIVKIANLLNISRTPISDAMNQLMEEGLVVAPPNRKGYYVFDISFASLEQMFMARKALEGTAAYICARNNTAVDLKRLHSLAESFRAAFEARDFKSSSEYDTEFHMLIIKSCGNPYIIKMYSSLNRLIAYYSVRSQDYLLRMKNDPELGIIASQHMSIYRAIEFGMPELAETASKTHMDNCYNLSVHYHTMVSAPN